MRWIVFAAVALIGACASEERFHSSRLQPNPDGSFFFTARPALIYGPGAETEWLDASLAENGLCPNGHEVTDHQRVRVATTITGDPFYEHQIRGRCR